MWLVKIHGSMWWEPFGIPEFTGHKSPFALGEVENEEKVSTAPQICLFIIYFVPLKTLRLQSERWAESGEEAKWPTVDMASPAKIRLEQWAVRALLRVSNTCQLTAKLGILTVYYRMCSYGVCPDILLLYINIIISILFISVLFWPLQSSSLLISLQFRT